MGRVDRGVAVEAEQAVPEEVGDPLDVLAPSASRVAQRGAAPGVDLDV